MVAGLLGLGALYFTYLCNGLSYDNRPAKVSCSLSCARKHVPLGRGCIAEELVGGGILPSFECPDKVRGRKGSSARPGRLLPFHTSAHAPQSLLRPSS